MSSGSNKVDFFTPIGLMLIGALLITSGLRYWRPLSAGGAFFTIVGLIWLMREQKRAFGLKVEKKAIQSLALPDGWEIHPNLPVPEHGDVDILVIDPKKTRFAIEIKSYGTVKKKGGVMNRQQLVYLDGTKLPRNPVEQILNIATLVQAEPVLWLPRAKGPTLKLSSGVIVVQGSHRKLKRAIGAAGWWAGWF